MKLVPCQHDFCDVVILWERVDEPVGVAGAYRWVPVDSFWKRDVRRGTAHAFVCNGCMVWAMEINNRRASRGITDPELRARENLPPTWS